MRTASGFCHCATRPMARDLATIPLARRTLSLSYLRSASPTEAHEVSAPAPQDSLVRVREASAGSRQTPRQLVYPE